MAHMTWECENELKGLAYDMACHHYATGCSVVGGLADVIFMMHARGDILTPAKVGIVEQTYNACREMLDLKADPADIYRLAVKNG